jgi:hypothetical protein
VAHSYDPKLLGEAEIKRIAVQGQSRQYFKISPISKITREKWTGDVGQAVE